MEQEDEAVKCLRTYRTVYDSSTDQSPSKRDLFHLRNLPSLHAAAASGTTSAVADKDHCSGSLRETLPAGLNPRCY